MSLYDSARDNLVKCHFKVNEPRKDLNYRPIKKIFIEQTLTIFAQTLLLFTLFPTKLFIAKKFSKGRMLQIRKKVSTFMLLTSSSHSDFSKTENMSPVVRALKRRTAKTSK